MVEVSQLMRFQQIMKYNRRKGTDWWRQAGHSQAPPAGSSADVTACWLVGDQTAFNTQSLRWDRRWESRKGEGLTEDLHPGLSPSLTPVCRSCKIPEELEEHWAFLHKETEWIISRESRQKRMGPRVKSPDPWRIGSRYSNTGALNRVICSPSPYKG